MENIVNNFVTSCSKQFTKKFHPTILNVTEITSFDCCTSNFQKVYISCYIKITLFPIYFRVLTVWLDGDATKIS